MRPAAPSIQELLDLAREHEDGPELDRILDELGEHIVRGFKIRNRHLLALNDWSCWDDPQPRATLRWLARTTVREALALGVGPERFMRKARAELERLLEPPGHSRTIADDPARRVALDDVQLIGSAHDAGDQLVADELADQYRQHPDLTEGERAVLDARIALGPGATGREIAAEAGVTERSERELTRRLRAKLRPLVDKVPA